MENFQRVKFLKQFEIEVLIFSSHTFYCDLRKQGEGPDFNIF